MTNPSDGPPPIPPSWRPEADQLRPPPLGGELVPAVPAPSIPGPPPARSQRAWLIVLSILLVLVLGGGAVLTALLLRTSDELDRATELIQEQRQRLEEQDARLEELTEQLEEKEVFGAAMQGLMTTAKGLDGIPMGALVDFARIERLAVAAWEDRRDPAAMRERTAEARELDDELLARIQTAGARAGNASGTAAESLIDALGRGFVETVWGDAVAACGAEALGCVWGDAPYVIHLDAPGFDQPYRSDWGEQLVAYHEFAHVLQFTNPEPTEAALGAFGGDTEFMADCYALTMLDAWSLEERVWVDARRYWDVAYGYGRVCDEAQRDAIRTWIADGGVKYRAVSQ